MEAGPAHGIVAVVTICLIGIVESLNLATLNSRIAISEPITTAGKIFRVDIITMFRMLSRIIVSRFQIILFVFWVPFTEVSFTPEGHCRP